MCQFQYQKTIPISYVPSFEAYIGDYRGKKLPKKMDSGKR